MGAARHIPTDKEREQVGFLTGIGTRQADISKVLGISENTLRKHYEEELRLGGIRATAKVAMALYTNAVENNNTTAQIFWLKNRSGGMWSDNGPLVDEEDDDGAPQLTNTERRQRILALAQSSEAGGARPDAPPGRPPVATDGEGG